jgi:hypothetical protein
MTEPEVFVLADRALQKVVDKIKDDQWAMELPPTFLRRGQEKVTLREIINYHAQDDAWVPDILAGKTIEEVGKDKFASDLLADDPKGNFGKYVEAACAAVSAITDLDKIAHLSYGDYSVRDYLLHITYFRGLRVYDIAKVIGISTTMPDDLVQGLWDELSEHAEEWRAMGVFKAQVEVPSDASLQDKLLGLTGRQPASK